MRHFISGAIMMGFWVGGMFFLRFWRKTRDSFFLIFALAFWILALERLPLAFVEPAVESRHYVYLIRLLAFILILFAIWSKNRAKTGPENQALEGSGKP